MSIRIISWDVGVIHLAYCVLEFNADTTQVEILDWDEINLIEDDRLELECCGRMKNDSICCKKASYYMILKTGDLAAYCKTHLAQYVDHESVADPMSFFTETTKSRTCDFVQRSGSACGKKAAWKSHDKKHYCQTHYKSALNKAVKTYSVHPIKNTVVKKYPTSQLQINLVNTLDKFMPKFASLNITEVVIENQPSLKNPKMKAIASTLFDWFLIRGYTDRGLNIDLIKLMCPSNKLKVDENNTLKVLKKNLDGGKKYKLTKELGIKYTKQLLEDRPDQLEYLGTFKKIDDLCDAYLQGRYYLEFYRPKNDIKFDNSTVKRTKKTGTKPKSKSEIIVI